MYAVGTPPSRRYERPFCALLLCLTVALAAFFSFYNLDGRSLSRADESLYARSTQEMLQNGSWVPTLHGSPFLHKPPLTQLLMGFSATLCGETTWAYRLPSAVAGFAFLVFIPYFAYRLFTSWLVAILSFAAILSCKVLFASHLIREAVPDGLLLFFLLVGLSAGWELWQELSSARDNTRRALLLETLLGVSVFMALLTKSVAGLATLIVWWLWMLTYGRRSLLPPQRFLTILVLTTLIPIGAFMLVYLSLLRAVPGTFDAAIHYEVIEKLLGAGHHNTTLPHYYISQLFLHARAFPSIVLGLALLFGIISTCKGDKRCAYLTLSVVVPLCGYSLLHSRLYWYIAPIFAPSAILIGYLLTSCIQISARRKAPAYKRALGGACFALSAAFLCEFILKIIQGPLLTQKHTKLELAVREILARKERDPGLRVIRLCIDQRDERLRGLLLREWFYLDMVKPISEAVCDENDIRAEMCSSANRVVITVSPPNPIVTEKSSSLHVTSIRLDNWKPKASPDRIRELLLLQSE